MESLTPPAASATIGIDPGSVRCGVAVADASQMLAVPLGSVATEPRLSLPERIQAFLDPVTAGLIVMGLPFDQYGKETASAGIARELAGALAKAWGAEIVFIDERFSSREAQRQWQEVHTGVKKGRAPGRREMVRLKQSGQLDALAAVSILQGYLDQRRSEHDVPECI